MTIRKFWDVDHPPVVVLAGEDPRRERLETALSESTGFRVETVPSAADALDRLDRRPAVECLWFPHRLPDATAVELAADALERDPDVGLVLAPHADASSARLASEATAAGVTDYVHDGTIEEHVDRLEAAVDRAIDRHHEAEKRGVLDAMLSELEIPIFVKDEQARVLLAADVDGWPDPEEAFGKTDLELYHSHLDNVRRSYDDDVTVLETGEPVFDRPGQFDDGAERHWTRTTKIPWNADGEQRGLVSVTFDVTDLKWKERKLVRQVARLKQFPDYVAHDLRNPLQIARGYVDLAEEGHEGALAEIDEALERMAELIDDFQTMVGRDHEYAAGVRPVDFPAFVEDVWARMASESAALEIDLESDVRIVAIESQLRPLLENLFRNALDHAGPDVSIRVGQLDDGFYVEDDGPGIPGDERDDVFEHGHTTSADGTGMGLSIVAESVMAHDWHCSVTDGAAGGARFEISNCTIGTPLSATAAGPPIELDAAADVGDVPFPGESTGDLESGRYELVGSGRNVWSDTNEFHYRYATVEDGVRIQGRVAELDGPFEYSKAGFMVRSGLDEDAAYGYVGLTPAHGPELLWRPEPGVPGRSNHFEHAVHEYDWFRLERLGDRVVCSVSTDGDTWEAVDRRTVDLPDSVVVGIAVSPSYPDTRCEAVLEDVSVVPIDADSA